MSICTKKKSSASCVHVSVRLCCFCCCSLFRTTEIVHPCSDIFFSALVITGYYKKIAESKCYMSRIIKSVKFDKPTTILFWTSWLYIRFSFVFHQIFVQEFFKDVRGWIIPATWLFYNTTKSATRLNFSEKRSTNGKLNHGKVFNIYSIINSFLAAD